MTQSPGFELPSDRISDVCKRYRIKELSIFGSAVRGELRPESDIDVLVDFESDAHIGLVKFALLNEELERLLGRRVDLVTNPGLKPWVRPHVLREARIVYAA